MGKRGACIVTENTYICRKKGHYWLCGLQTSAATRLIGAGFTSKDEVLAALHDGRLCRVKNNRGNPRYHGLGNKGLENICEWLGVSPTILKPPQPDPPGPGSIHNAIVFLERHGYEVIKAS